MSELAKEIVPVNIEDELKQSYLDYAMSVLSAGRCQMFVTDLSLSTEEFCMR